MLFIRPFEPTDKDYQTLVDLKHAVWPFLHFNIAMFKARDEKLGENLLANWVAEVENDVAGIGIALDPEETQEADFYRLHVEVFPEFQGRGIGTALFERLEDELLGRGAKILAVQGHETQPQGIEFLERRGYVSKLREHEFRLDLNGFDVSKFAWVTDKIAEYGIRIITLSQLKRESSTWLHDWRILHNAILQDVPTTVPWGTETDEDFAKNHAYNSLDEDGVFFALDGTYLVGVSVIEKRSPQVYEQHITGILPEYRRKAIAKALKLKTIEFAKAHGATTITTLNEENNPMLKLNLQLGFEQLPAWVYFLKEIT